MSTQKITPILLCVILILLIYTIFFNNKDYQYDTQKQKIKDLSISIKAIEIKQLESDSIILAYQVDIAVLDLKIDTAKKKIIAIRKYYNDKINSLNQYTPNQLDSFFTDRYK